MQHKTFPYKRVLVTGGTGFVGSHLVEQLLLQGVEVYTISRGIDPYSYFISKGLDKRIVTIFGDIRSYDCMKRVINAYDIQFIYHLAAQPIVTTAYRNPVETLSTNIMGTVNLLEAVREHSFVKGIIIASSDKAYGRTEHEYSEQHPLQGTHPYDVSKSSADLITQAYIKTYGIPAVITRFGNIYGEGDRNMSRVIPGILESVIRRQIFEIRSNGEYVREYLYVGDVVSGYIELAHNFSNVVGQAFNFGTEYRRSVLELIKDLEYILQREIPYKILNQAKNEIPYQALSWKKIHSLLGWQPKKTIQEAIPSLYVWYSNYFDKKNNAIERESNILFSLNQAGK